MNTDFRLRADDLTWQPLDGDIVVLDLRTSRYLRLNDTAAVLWEHLEGGASRDELVAALLARYDVDREVALADVESVLHLLTEHDLVTVEASAQALR